MFALKRIDLCLKPNEILGLIGPNGAGKTTLLDLIGSYHKRSQGEIYLKGTKIDENVKFSNQRNMSSFFDDVGLCLQEDVFWEDLTILKHLEMICDLKGISIGAEEERKYIIDTWLEAFSLINFKDYKA